MINGIKSLGIDLDTLFSAKLADVAELNTQKAQDISDRIDARNQLQKDLRELVSIARKPDLTPQQKLAEIKKHLEGNPELAKLVESKLPKLSKTEESTTSSINLSKVEDFVRRNVPGGAQILGLFGGSVDSLLNALPAPLRDAAKAAGLTTTTSTKETALSKEEADKVFEGFIDDLQGINDDFSPVNQKDLAALQRIVTQETQTFNALSNIMSAGNGVKNNIIGNFKG